MDPARWRGPHQGEDADVFASIIALEVDRDDRLHGVAGDDLGVPHAYVYRIEKPGH